MDTLFCFDLDGTITSEELLPKIARLAGVYPQIKKLTELTISGEIPFEDSLRLRVEILKHTPLEAIHEVVKNVSFFSLIQNFMKHRRDDCFIITGNLDKWVTPIEARLGITVFASQATYSAVTGTNLIKIIDKGSVVNNLRNSTRKRIVAIGDGYADISMLSNSDIGVAFGGVHPPIISLVEHATHVIHREDTLCRFLKSL
jgi:phosphoserine phosphatase